MMRRLLMAIALLAFLVCWLVLDAREAPLLDWLATLFTNRGTAP